MNGFEASALLSITPLSGAFDITPSDTLNLNSPTRSIYVGVAGDLKVQLQYGNAVVIVNASGWLSIVATKVFSTGTTAESIIGLY